MVSFKAQVQYDPAAELPWGWRVVCEVDNVEHQLPGFGSFTVELAQGRDLTEEEATHHAQEIKEQMGFFSRSDWKDV